MPKLDASKLSALKTLLKKNKLDGLIISDVKDLKYILGKNIFFFQNEGILLAYDKGLYLAARSLYKIPLSSEYPEIKIEGFDYCRENKIIETAKKLKLKNVAFDFNKEMYYSGKAYIKAGFKEFASLIASLRVSKTETELEIMRRSAKIVYGALPYIKKLLKIGVTEKEIAAKLDDYMMSKGASGTSFTTLVSFGPNGANPHHMPGDFKLKNNMPIMLDFGCVYQNYCSDITRTFWYGNKPSAEFKKIFDIVKTAHDKAAKEAKYGMTGAQIDAIARSQIEAAGYGKYFTHRTGHGIGIEAHEEADISRLNKNKIGLNYCFSIEPGIYLEGKFGVRYEDCFYMTKNGTKILN
ncbi:MAG: aminopeptidase P family protein [Elusimicrobiota bacterium]|jgi:Xaa-Pro aminopeptidase|nr:aminopeptidase P family protein [Elusimicrobiota bacterium]